MLIGDKGSKSVCAFNPIATSRKMAEAGKKDTAHLQVIKVPWHVVEGSTCVKQLTAGEVFARFDFVLKDYKGSL